MKNIRQHVAQLCKELGYDFFAPVEGRGNPDLQGRRTLRYAVWTKKGLDGERGLLLAVRANGSHRLVRLNRTDSID